MERIYRRVVLRSGVSLAFYILFVVLAVVHTFVKHPYLNYAVIVPVILAVMILPRAVYPKQEPTEEERPFHESLPRMGIWLTYTRAIYLVVAVALLFGLPELVHG